MLAQRDENNVNIDVIPRILLLPPELAAYGRELLFSDYVQRAADDPMSPTGNSNKGTCDLVVEPRLSNDARFTGTSTTAWYLFADPARAAMIVSLLERRRVAHRRISRHVQRPRRIGGWVALLV